VEVGQAGRVGLEGEVRNGLRAGAGVAAGLGIALCEQAGPHDGQLARAAADSEIEITSVEAVGQHEDEMDPVGPRVGVGDIAMNPAISARFPRGKGNRGVRGCHALERGLIAGLGRGCSPRYAIDGIVLLGKCGTGQRYQAGQQDIFSHQASPISTEPKPLRSASQADLTAK
jgi:hypothetical protein